MVRYFLTDLRGNPIYTFAQRRILLRNRNNNNNRQQQNARLTQLMLQRSTHHHPHQEQQQQEAAAATTAATEATFTNTTLVCMIRNRDWENVIRRVSSHPNEVLVVDVETGNTVLHVACRLNPPPNVITQLALPTTCRHANRDGTTPLHVASSHRCSAASLRALLEACHNHHNNAKDDNMTLDDDNTTASSTVVLPSSPTADLSRMGRAPIHYACMSFRGLEMDAFRLLLDATLKEGNVWVEREEEGTTTNHNNSESRDDDDFDSFMDETCGFDESERDLYLQHSTVDEDWTEANSHKNVIKTSIWVNVMGLKDATGQTPLALLFRRYRERVRCVITTVDRLRQSHQDHPDRAALVAAVRVHADLGELWEKARWIVARLTEERLQREVEQQQQQQQQQQEEDDAMAQGTLQRPKRRDATSRRATYFGGSKSSSFYDSAKFAEPPSPVEAAVAQAAASWAVEQHPERESDESLPLASRVSTDIHSTARQFRIVHASVGLTGYGCPPELIRLAISIHPQQIMEMDEDGNLPLHIAVTAASYLATAHAATEQYPTAAAVAAAAATVHDNNDDHSVLSDAAQSFFSSATVSQTTNPFNKVIKILLQQYPEAARMPQGKTGRLPLVLALESGRRTWEDGIRTLLNAYPPALHNKKIVPPYLYPNVLALVANNGTCCLGGGTGGVGGFGRMVDFLPVVGEEEVAPRKRNKKQSKRAIRQETCSRTTLFELLRTNSEWATHGFDLETDKE